MRKLKPEEAVLEGTWIQVGTSMRADAVALRIEELAETHLVELARDSSGWFILFEDPDDGRLWELSYLQSETHGGGPPRLVLIEREDARKRYSISLAP